MSEALRTFPVEDTGGDGSAEFFVNALYEAEEFARATVEDEEDPEDPDFDPNLGEVATFVVADEEDRPIRAIRVDREPGTNHFTLVLLTEEA